MTKFRFVKDINFGLNAVFSSDLWKNYFVYVHFNLFMVNPYYFCDINFIYSHFPKYFMSNRKSNLNNTILYHIIS